MLAERFEDMEKTRSETIKRITDSIWEKEELLKSDMEKERQAREESLTVIRDCVERDFPNLESQI